MRVGSWLLGLAIIASAAPSQIALEQHVWGFGGRVAADRFNPLSLLLHNPTIEPFDGTLSLERGDGTDVAVGSISIQQTPPQPQS